MSTIDIVEGKVKSFINDKELFTSVDISNAVKRDGTWVSNRDVAKFLRNYDFSGTGYEKSRITVANGATASLYHPDYADPSHYNKTSQKALTPKDVNIGLQTPSVTPVTSAVNLSTEKKVSCTSAKIRIPAKIIKQLGWFPGDKVDSSKVDVSAVLDKSISNRIKVNSDGRINLSTASLKPSVLRGNKVSVGVANGMVYLKGV